MKKIIYFSILIFTLFTIQSFGQNLTPCMTTAVEDPDFDTKEYQDYEKEFLDKIYLEEGSADCVKDVHVRFHIIRNDNGTGGLDTSKISPAMDIVKLAFAELKINFVVLDYNFIDNSSYYNASGTTYSIGMSEIYNDDYTMNVYCLPILSGACGIGSYPWGSSNKYILMNNGCMSDTKTLAHEFGHNFGLYHPHDFSETVDGNNCIQNGDRVCDTPADPNLIAKVNNNCQYIGTSTDSNGDFYNPDVTNIMSYSRNHCSTNFTPGQFARMSYYKDLYPQHYFMPPTGYEYLGTWQGKQYYISNGITDPVTAATEAQTLGGELAVIETEEENIYLASRISEPVLLGLNDANVEGTLEWGNSAAVNFTNFEVCGTCPVNDSTNDYVLLQGPSELWSFTNVNSQNKYIVEVSCVQEMVAPDLQLTGFETNLSEIGYLGQASYVTVDLSNIGNVIVDQAYSIRVIISPDNVIDTWNGSDQNDIFLGDTTILYTGLETISNITIPFDIPININITGSSFLYVVADFGNNILELTKENNIASLPLTLLASQECVSLLDEFLFLGDYGTSSYFYFDYIMTPSEATAYANSLGGHLAVINTPGENDFLHSNFPYNIVAYIGINDVASEGNFEWANGDAINFTNWDICNFCEPNTETNDYVIMHPWNGGWSFANNARNFIMEISCNNIVSGLPDLVLSNPSGVPSTTGSGNVIDLLCEIDNIGTGDVVGSYVTAAYLSTDDIFNTGDIYLGEISNANTSSGSTQNIQISFSIPSIADGDYFIILETDVNGEITESDEANNGIEIPISIFTIPSGGCPPEITGFTSLGEYNGSKYFISDGTSQPAAAQAVAQQNGGYLAVINDQAENDFIQQNISEMAYIGLNDIQTEGTLVWENGDPLNYNNINPCSFCNENAADLDYVIMAPWDGTWSFSSQWNPRKYIVEFPCDSGIGVPDLTLSNPSGYPSVVNVGDPINLTFDLNNIGTGAVTGDFVIAAYLSIDVLFDASDVYLADLTTGNTPIGTESGFQLSFNIPPNNFGDHYIIIIADVNGVVTELNSNNNGIEVPIEILMETGGDCPPDISGFTTLGEHNGSKYFISNGISQPAAAQAVAQQNNGYLAVINDQAENDFIQQNISEMVYIGLNDVQTEGTLVWENGDPLNYNNINPCSFCNENTDDLDYVIMAPWDGAWSFSSQWNARKYIVEVPCDNTGGSSITLNCPADLEFTTDPITGLATLDFADATGSTTCPEGSLIIFNAGLIVSGDQVGVGVYTITYEAIDACGNVESCIFDITVIEGTTPSFEITYECPTEFPQTGIWEIPITMTNNTSNVTSPLTLSLFKETFSTGPNPQSPFGQMQIPALEVGESLTVTLETTLPNITQYIPNRTTFPPNYIAMLNHNDYYISRSVTVPVKTLPFDFYCKKYTTDLEVAIQNPAPNYNSNNEITYSVAVTNNGNEDAFNIKTNLIETIASSYGSAMPPNTPVEYSVDFNNMSQGNWEREMGGTYAWLIPNLAVGETATVDVVYHLDDPLEYGNNLPEMVTIDVSVTSGHLIDSDNSNNSDSFNFQKETTGGDCPPSISGFTSLGEYNGSKYFISDETSQPADAQLVAQQNGGYLAVINDQMENDFIQQNISEMVYIGLNDVQTEGTLVWENGDPLNYNNVNPCSFCNENSEDLDYVIMTPWDGAWSFSSQWNPRKYIVEVPCQGGGIMNDPNCSFFSEFTYDENLVTQPIEIREITDGYEIDISTDTQIERLTIDSAGFLVSSNSLPLPNPIPTNAVRSETSDAYYAISASGIDLTISKNDYNNIEIWSKTYNDFFPNNTNTDLGFDVLETSDGILFTMHSFKLGIKTDLVGNEIWRINFLASNVPSATGTFIGSAALDGGYYITSNPFINVNQFGFHVSKIDELGNQLWETLANPVFFFGNELFLGESPDGSAIYTAGNIDQVQPLILKINTNDGSVAWSRRFNPEDGEFDYGYKGTVAGATFTTDGNLVVGASLNHQAAPLFRGFIWRYIKLDVDTGDQIWEHELPWEIGIPAVGVTSLEDWQINISTSDGGFLITNEHEGIFSVRKANSQGLFDPICNSNNDLPNLTIWNMRYGCGNTGSIGSIGITSGSTCPIGLDVANTGFTNQTGSFVISAYLSNDDVLDVGDVLLQDFPHASMTYEVLVQEQFDLSIPALSDGTYHIIFKIDGNDEITESDEDDNVQASLEFMVNGGCLCTTISNYPVCGSDGVTYGNACEAECAGVSFTNGACPATCPDPLAWSTLISNSNNSSHSLNDTYFVNENVGWVVGGAHLVSRIRKTSDGGNTWIVQNANANQFLRTVFFLDENIGWAAGSGGAIVHTNDGGDTWVQQFSGLNNVRLEDIFFINEQVGWAVGNDPTILKTTDGGNTWNFQNGNLGSTYRKVVFFDTQVGYVIGWDQGFQAELLKTNNGGQTWEILPLTTGGEPSSMFFINENEGWIITYSGEVFHTTDGGQTYENFIQGGELGLGSYYDIFFVDSENGQMISSQGRFFITDDGGKSWLLQNVPLTTHFTNFHFANENTGFAVGSFGNVVKYGVVTPDFSNYTYLGELDNHEYYISNNTASWDLAQTNAIAIGGHLATVNSQTENDFLQQHISELTYIGLNDLTEEGVVGWVNNETFSFSNFDDCSFCNDNGPDLDVAFMQNWNGKWSWGSVINPRKYIVEISCDPIMLQSIEEDLFLEPTLEVVNFDETILQEIFPNPTQNNLNIKIFSPIEQEVDVQVFDARGLLFKNIPIELEAGTNTSLLTISELPSGFYTIFIPQIEGGKSSMRFIKIDD